MGRLPLANASDDALLAELESRIRERGLEVPNLYLTIGNAPAMLQGWMGFTWPLRHDATTPRELRELVIMRVAQVTRCAYMWAHHWPMATAHGITTKQLAALGEWRTNGLFSEAQGTILGYADQVIQGDGVLEATFNQLKNNYAPREIIELTLAATFYLNLARFAMALDIDIEPEYEELARLLP
jgi:AhpD family alkylhydroperoxidase